MPVSRSVAVRIPDPLLGAIDARVGVDGKNRSEVIITLLQKGLAISPTDAALILERLNAIEGKLPDWKKLLLE